MAGGGFGSGDLLGDYGAQAVDRDYVAQAVDRDLYSPAVALPGQTVDLSGASSIKASPGSSFRPSSFESASAASGAWASAAPPRGAGVVPTSFGGASYSDGGPSGFGSASFGNSRGPDSIEGGGSSMGLGALSPGNIARHLASRPVSELVTEGGRTLLNVPRIATAAYSAAARKFLRPWNEFLRLRPGRILEGLRGASRRGEIQIHLQRNVLANARAFCPNYAFVFLATLFMFVCTSPMLLCMLGAVGGGWAHATRSESFRNKPWQLQIGSVSVPLGSNMKTLLMSLPTLLFLHFFMGPVLWSAALCSGGASVAHAALRDRDDDNDPEDHGDCGNGTGVRLTMASP